MRLLPILALVGVATAARLDAQQQPAPATPKSAVEARDEMQSALLWLVAGQEAYWFKQHDSYTTDLAAIRAGVVKQPPADVVLIVHHAGGRAWAASAEHRGHGGISCVIYVGSLDDFPAPATLRDRRRPAAGQTGMPLCDEP